MHCINNYCHLSVEMKISNLSIKKKKNPMIGFIPSIIKRKLYDWQVWEEGLLELWPQSYYLSLPVEWDVIVVTTNIIHPHIPINHRVFSLFMALLYVSILILMKQHLYFLYYMWTTLCSFAQEDIHVVKWYGCYQLVYKFQV